MSDAYTNNARKGYTVVASATVIAVVILLMTTALSQGLLGQEQSTVILDEGLASQSAAEACVEAALLELAMDQDYAGNEDLTIGNVTCTIRPISGGATTVIQTESAASDSTYRLQVELSNLSPLTISSWQRVDEF